MDNVIGRCRETVWRKNPGVDSTGKEIATADHATPKTDAKGRAYCAVPRLNPIDCYYLFNPDGYYRAE